MTIRRLTILSLCLATLFSATIAQSISYGGGYPSVGSQTGVINRIPDSLSHKVDSILSKWDNSHSPGCALALLKDGEMIYARGYGMSNLEYNLPITPASPFHVASISKQFTAACIQELAHEGKLSLKDDVRKYIPEVPDFGHVITLDNLLHHTSGLRDQWDLQAMAGWREGDVITEDDILEMLSRQKALNFLPGEEYLYCNTGFTLLGIVVRKVTGVPLRKYADSVFFKPLGMNSTVFHSDHAEMIPNRTSAYESDDQGQWKINIPVFDNYGATSLFTTVGDLARWDENFYTHKVGGDQLIKAMLTTDSLTDGTPMNYASGLVIGEFKGNRLVEHNGADAGYRAAFLRFPDQHFSVILLANLADINPSDLARNIASLFLPDRSNLPDRNNLPDHNNLSVRNNRPVRGKGPGRTDLPVRSKGAVPYQISDSTLLLRLTGFYFDFRSKARWRVRLDKGQLYLGNNKLQPLNDTAFTSPNMGGVFTFRVRGGQAGFTLQSPGMLVRHFDRITRITLTKLSLPEYTGTFYSPELDVKYVLSVKDTSLMLKCPRNEPIRLNSYCRNYFVGPLTIEFIRNDRNEIRGIMASTGRSRNIYFEKLK